MATIKKAQLGGLIKKGLKATATAAPKKVTIPPGLKKSLKKSQSGPTKITPYSSEAERIAAGKKTFLQKKPYAERDYDKPSYLERETKPKSKVKTDKYGFDTRPDRNGGAHKAKNGKSFPDLNKDGKITKADILKGRGVIAKNGKPVKKAALGALLPLAMKAAPMVAGMFGGKGKSGGIGGMLGGLLGGKNGKTVKKSRSGSSIKKAQDGGYMDAGELIPKAGPMRKTKTKERSTDGNYVTKKVTRTRKGATTTSTKTRRTLQGYLDGAPRVSELKNGGKAKSGTSMKKCKYGCK